MIWIYALILIISLFFLVYSSNLFVNSSSKIAKQLGVSEIIIGLTLVAIGTSTPELFSAIAASLQKEGALIIGNIVGANIANISLIFGISLFLVVYLKKNEDILRELKFLFLIYLLFFIFSLDLKISSFEGAAFILLLAYYLSDVFRRKSKPEEYLKRHIKVREIKKESFFDSIKNYLLFVFSLIILVFSSKYLVNSAVNIADYFNISTKIIGVLMAIGTTFPELSVTIQAARKRFRGILVGDLVGSCIVNVIMVLGISSVISPILLGGSIFVEISLMFLTAFLTYLFFSRIRYQKALGYSLIGIYFLFLIFEFIII